MSFGPMGPVTVKQPLTGLLESYVFKLFFAKFTKTPVLFA